MSRYGAEGHKTSHKNKIFQPQEKVIEESKSTSSILNIVEISFYYYPQAINIDTFHQKGLNLI